MKPYLFALLFTIVPTLASVGQAQPVLSVDFNDRGADAGANTLAGFDSYFIGDIGGAALAQTNATTRMFGTISLTISGNSSNPIYDDRRRNTPVDGGSFTQGLLLRDFIFSASTAAGAGLNVTVDGLMPDQVYQVTIWSFDSTSVRNRVSDWSANGLLQRENYTFDGLVLPTTDSQYQFSFKVAATAAGQIAIQGRRDGSTAAADPGVFINALQIAPALPDPPVVSGQPADTEVFTGDNAGFAVQISGTPPYQFLWYKAGASLPNETNSFLIVSNATAADAVLYSVAVTNSAGGTVSGNALLTVRPVLDITTGLISHWPLDTVVDPNSTPDVTANANDLLLLNLDANNLGTGKIGNAFTFNGTNALLARFHNSSFGLPIYNSPSYAVALWVKGDFTGQNDRRVFAEGSTNSITPIMSIGTHSQASSGVVDIFIRNDSSSPLDHRRSSLIAFDNQWHHIVWIDNNGSGSVYVDGVRDTGDFNYRRGALTANTTSIGGLQRAAAGNWFAGMIDDVAVWRRSLTSNEVQQVFANGPVPAPLHITSIRIDGADLEIVFTSPAPGVAHFVVATTDLENPNFSTVSNVTFTGPVGSTLTARFPRPAATVFYRVSY